MASPQLAERLRERFPDLVVEPLRQLDTGLGSTVVEASDGVVFRIARGARAAEGHRRELELLPQLRDRVPLEVPDLRWRIEPDEAFPYGAVGYRKLPGHPVPATGGTPELAVAVAGFLKALHWLQDVRADVVTPDFEALRAVTAAPLENALFGHERGRLESWWEELLADAELRAFEPTLRHGDLWYENLLSAEGRLSGVLDWEAAGLADPAEDFAPLHHLGAPFADEALAAYRAGEAFRHRARRHWELRALHGIRAAIELGGEPELHDALRKLRAGPILQPE